MENASPINLVATADFGIQGINFYYIRREAYNLTADELSSVGVTNEKAYVHEAIIGPLQRANDEFRKADYEILVKDAYRSAEFYELIYRKRCEKFGKEATDALLNIETMPHSTGKAVDISLLSLFDGKELWFRNGQDGDAAFFIGYYASSNDPSHQEFERRQKMLRSIMMKHGFKLGMKNEYWHFEYAGI